MDTPLSANRRDFLKGATTASAVLAAGAALNAHAQGTSDEIRVGVVGCGGRGSGAADNVLNSAPRVKIVALADVFEGQAKSLRNKIDNQFSKSNKVRELGNGGEITNDRMFVGLDAFQKLIDCPEVNYVILATPPGFRPMHIEAAVKAGKTLFTEKPVAVDPAGVRRVLAAADEAKAKGLRVVAGTQRRHQLGYVETVKRLHDGDLGTITGLRVYWNGQGIWFHKRKPDVTDVAYHLNNWYHFLWTCGDHICEQHIHNLDVANWVMQGPPIRCDGIGSRTPGNPSRPAGDPKDVGHIFDNFSIDYEYPGGVHMYSSCRHIPNTTNNVSEAVVGTNGVCQVDKYTIRGRRIVGREADRRATDPYVQEHTDLIAAVRETKPINELKQVAESTLTAIMGRMAAYTGRPVTWDFAMNSKLDTFPKNLTWDSKLEVEPTPVPGKTPLI
ncbi:MAG: Gfo/Idh/MocA family oxidoreductase [Gemmataceae bacterium]